MNRSEVIPKRSGDIQPGIMTKHRLKADMDYLNYILELLRYGEDPSNSTRRTILYSVIKDFEALIDDYISFNESGTAIKIGDGE